MIDGCQSYEHEGKRWLVGVDLEKFFDVVKRDILMQCLRKLRFLVFLTAPSFCFSYGNLRQGAKQEQ